VQAAALRAEAGGELSRGLGRGGQLVERDLRADGGVDQLAQRGTERADGVPADGAPLRAQRPSWLMPASRSSAPPMITRCTSLVPSYSRNSRASR
jgi:hypothetical protein